MILDLRFQSSLYDLLHQFPQPAFLLEQSLDQFGGLCSNLLGHRSGLLCWSLFWRTTTSLELVDDLLAVPHFYRNFVAQPSNTADVTLNNHPVCGFNVAIATFSWLPQPPLLARRGERARPVDTFKPS